MTHIQSQSRQNFRLANNWMRNYDTHTLTEWSTFQACQQLDEEALTLQIDNTLATPMFLFRRARPPYHRCITGAKIEPIFGIVMAAGFLLTADGRFLILCCGSSSSSSSSTSSSSSSSSSSSPSSTSSDLHVSSPPPSPASPSSAASAASSSSPPDAAGPPTPSSSSSS